MSTPTGPAGALGHIGAEYGNMSSPARAGIDLVDLAAQGLHLLSIVIGRVTTGKRICRDRQRAGDAREPNFHKTQVSMRR